MNTDKVNNDFMEVLSRKSGTELAMVQNLFNTIKNLQEQEYVSDKELLSLNRQVQNFYKK